MKPEDIEYLHILGRPAISPDGKYASVSVTKADLSADDYHSELLMCAVDGSAPPRRITYGDYDSMPSFSPDGRWLAFVRPGSNGRPQIHLLPMDGGEPRQVTDQPLGTGMAVWSPDSTRIAYTARVPQTGRYCGPPGLEPPRRISRLIYYVDGFGHTGDRPRQLFVTDPFSATMPATRVTAGDYDNWDVAWSPDGDLLTFASARHQSRNDDARTDVWVCAPDGSGARPLTEGGMYLFSPRFSADGTVVCFCGSELDAQGHSNALRSYGVWSVPAHRPQTATRLTDDRFHLSFASQMMVPARDGVYFAPDSRGAVDLILVPYDGGEPKVVIAGQRQVNGYAVAESPYGPTVAAVVTSGESAGDLLAHSEGGERMLTSYGSDVRDRAGLRPVEPFTATTADGYVLHGWIVRPEGPGPHPVILQVKGGPFTQFGYTLSGPAALDEAQVYASAGFAVVLGNPRGCAGYGQAHGSYVEGDLPRKSACDLLALLDAALADPSLDGDRVGVMGGSFGGYMAAWMSAHHPDRFRAAIGERGLYAIDSYLATSDDGVEVVIGIYGPDRAQWAWQSPINYVDQMKLPMLIIHSEEDRHCPMEQAQRLFVELKLRGIEAEMLLFPGEGHDMSRTGLPSHRIARFEAILDWWRRHLRVSEDDSEGN